MSSKNKARSRWSVQIQHDKNRYAMWFDRSNMFTQSKKKSTSKKKNPFDFIGLRKQTNFSFLIWNEMDMESVAFVLARKLPNFNLLDEKRHHKNGLLVHFRDLWYPSLISVDHLAKNGFHLAFDRSVSFLPLLSQLRNSPVLHCDIVRKHFQKKFYCCLKTSLWYTQY